MSSLISSTVFDYRIVQAFESIVDTLISQDNFKEVRVIEDELALIAKRVSK